MLTIAIGSVLAFAVTADVAGIDLRSRGDTLRAPARLSSSSADDLPSAPAHVRLPRVLRVSIEAIAALLSVSP